MGGFEEIWLAYERHGFEALLAFVAEDVVWEEVPSAPGAQVYHGHAGLRALYDRWQQDFDGFHFERTGPTQIVAEDVVATPVNVVGRGRGSGIDVDWQLWLVTRLREGKIVHARYAESLEAAREQL